ELGIALRWPGRWRERLVDAIVAAVPALTAASPEPAPTAGCAASAGAIAPGRLEFTSPLCCGLVGVDGQRGGRLLLFPPDGGLVLFTGERLGLEPAGVTSALRFTKTADGGRAVRYDGPLLRFPDTTPFLDLEAGLARAHVVDGAVGLDFLPAHPACASGGFGTIHGRVAIDGVREDIVGSAFAEDGGGGTGPWPRLRTQLRLADDVRLVLTVGFDGAGATGFVCRGGRHVAIAAARATLAGPDGSLERVALEVRLSDGEELALTVRTTHRLPVIRARGAAPIRIEFAACRLDGDASGSSEPVGWLEAGGL
ncbi:MAG TPA: hypothetical protein VKA21_06680, partial [Candidatus Binatia bacterium]|nr:hypothetical protein [Candidatus Binatia bacterium]